MKIVLKVLATLIVLFVAVMVLQLIASESGEVVVVQTQGSDGSAQETRLWVVDHDGSMWLRSGSPAAGWYQRISSAEQIVVERAGVSQTMTATPMVEMRSVINESMAAKYGWADQLIGILFGRDGAIAIRLEPR